MVERTRYAQAINKAQPREGVRLIVVYRDKKDRLSAKTKEKKVYFSTVLGGRTTELRSFQW